MDEIFSYVNQRVPTILLVIGILLATLVVARRVRVWVRSGTGRFGVPEEIANLCGSISFVAVIFLGVAIALAQAGWSTAASSFLAGLGITSIIIGMAIQDMFRGYTSGIMLLYHRPYQVGDEVTIANIRGTVTAIRMHVTIIRSQDGAIVAIPSNAISTNPITNHSRSGLRRNTLHLTIPRDTQTDTLLQELPDILQRTAAIAPEPAPITVITGLSGDSMTVEISFWSTADAESNGSARTNAILAINRLFVGQSTLQLK
jgi:small conductance mechanosensitive channel